MHSYCHRPQFAVRIFPAPHWSPRISSVSSMCFIGCVLALSVGSAPYVFTPLLLASGFPCVSMSLFRWDLCTVPIYFCTLPPAVPRVLAPCLMQFPSLSLSVRAPARVIRSIITHFAFVPVPVGLITSPTFPAASLCPLPFPSFTLTFTDFASSVLSSFRCTCSPKYCLFSNSNVTCVPASYSVIPFQLSSFTQIFCSASSMLITFPFFSAPGSNSVRFFFLFSLPPFFVRHRFKRV